MPAQTIIKLRRGTAAQWTTANPVLAAGEIGLETDTNKTKYGNGATAWTSLPYSVADASGTSAVDWTAILNKPTEFTPSAHAASHEFGGIDAIEIEPSQVTGLNAFISDVQATLPNKQDKVTGVSDTEIGYLDGVTSGIQAQLNTKASKANPEFTVQTGQSGSVQIPFSVSGFSNPVFSIDYATPDAFGLTSGGTITFANSADLNGVTVNVLSAGDIGSQFRAVVEGVTLADQQAFADWATNSGYEENAVSNFAGPVITISAEEVLALEGVTSNIQAQLDSKEVTFTNTFMLMGA